MKCFLNENKCMGRLQSLDWASGLDPLTGLVDWTGGLDWWTGLVNWTGGLTLKIIFTSLMRLTCL